MEHTRKFFTCDRCGVEMDKPVTGAERGPEAGAMTASFDVGVAGGLIFSWQHLCGGCNTFVLKTARDLAAQSKELKIENQ